MKRLLLLVALARGLRGRPAPLDLADDPAILSPVSTTEVASSVGASVAVEVRVTDAEGRPVPGYPVSSLASGGSAYADSSDADGLARARGPCPRSPASRP